MLCVSQLVLCVGKYRCLILKFCEWRRFVRIIFDLRECIVNSFAVGGVSFFCLKGMCYSICQDKTKKFCLLIFDYDFILLSAEFVSSDTFGAGVGV